MTTLNSTISEPYKLLTIAKAYIARQIAPWRKRHIWVWSVSDVSSRIRVRAALPCRPPWSTYPKTVEIICPKWNAYKLLFRSYTIYDNWYIFLSHTCAFIRAITRWHKNDMSRDIVFLSRDIVFCPAISFFVPLKTKMASDWRIDRETKKKYTIIRGK